MIVVDEKELKEIIIKDCNKWLDEQQLSNNIKNIETYITGLYYDLADDIEVIRDDFFVPKDLTDMSAIIYIENYIERILKENMKGR